MANSKIYLGSTNIGSLFQGTDDISIYLGDEKVYPTSFQGKWLATYTGGTTSSAECDSSSAITYNEITLTDLESVEIGNCVTTIGDNAFRVCTSLTSCTIGSGVTSIGESVFRDCSGLTSITIPSGVTSIGQYAFLDCSDLTSVTIGNGVTSIDDFAFDGCRSITSITVEATTPPTIGLGVFGGSTCPIYVPASSLSAYQSAWSYYASRIQAIP